jgi:membrane associated rhomboid family serine protease
MTDKYMPIKATLGFVASIWIIHFVAMFLPFIQNYGIVPRTATGLVGVVSSPFLHGSWSHLYANTGSLLIFGIALSLLESKKYLSIVVKVVVLGGLMTWLMGRSANHIGASGLVFGLFGYLLLVGFFKRNLKYILVSLIMLVSYGGIVFGVLPGQSGISWEQHLFGFVSGGLVARGDG